MNSGDSCSETEAEELYELGEEVFQPGDRNL